MAGRFVQYTGTATTDASGDATLLLGPPGSGAEGTDRPASLPNGEIYRIEYDKVDFAAGVDFTITTATSGITVWAETNVDASKTVYPRVTVHDTAGAPLVYAAAGEPVPDPLGIPLVDEQLSVVIANGGDTKTGTFTLTVRR